jgi:hypothetical protein
MEDYFKDIDLLGRDRKRVVYVDSRPLSFWTTGDNCNFELYISNTCKNVCS